MKQDHDHARDLLACLGHGSRYRIVERLARDQRCVSDLARDVSLSQSCTTRHLQALQRAGLVRGTRAGKRVMFHLCLEDPRVDALIGWAMAGGPAASTSAPGPADPRGPAGSMPGIRPRRHDRTPARTSLATPDSPAPASARPGEDPGAPRLDDRGGDQVPTTDDSRARPDDLEDYLL